MSRGRVLLVEDDAAILAGLTSKLRSEGFEVETAEDGEAARDRIAAAPLDLVVLDLMLPKLDGLGVLRWLRRRSPALPVLIVSAKGRETEKVEGLKAGADDYLTKPFGLLELMARVDALLRRAGGSDAQLELGACRIDLRHRKVFRGRREVKLSAKEKDILFYLARHRGRAVPRDEILDAVWGYTATSAGRAVDFHVFHLRQKLERDPENPRHLLTRHGEGYELVAKD
jgi:DNA-binding response OmpR family regulator